MATDAQSAERRMIMRLIDADRALEIVRDQGIAHPNAHHLTNYATLILREAPTVDAVPVLRCKDCKYWQDNNDGYPHEECRWGHGETPDANDFCSYGERKGGAN